jgi:hypothetical protein
MLTAGEVYFWECEYAFLLIMGAVVTEAGRKAMEDVRAKLGKQHDTRILAGHIIQMLKDLEIEKDQ